MDKSIKDNRFKNCGVSLAGIWASALCWEAEWSMFFLDVGYLCREKLRSKQELRNLHFLLPCHPTSSSPEHLLILHCSIWVPHLFRRGHTTLEVICVLEVVPLGEAGTALISRVAQLVVLDYQDLRPNPCQLKPPWKAQWPVPFQRDSWAS